MKNKIYFLLMISLILTVSNSFAQIASGGNFTLEKDVIANGGGESIDASNMFYKVAGTTGQKAVGTPMNGGNYGLNSGFWQESPLTPTAANVTISGRVVSNADLEQNPKNLQGISNAILTLTGGMMTAPRMVRTNAFGYFTFEEVETGRFYVLTVTHRKYQFLENTMAFTLFENLSDIIFRAVSN